MNTENNQTSSGQIGITTSIEELKAMTRQINTEIISVNDRFSQMVTNLKNIFESWNGETSNKYEGQLMALVQEKKQKMNEVLMYIVSTMETITSQISQADEQTVKETGKVDVSVPNFDNGSDLHFHDPGYDYSEVANMPLSERWGFVHATQGVPVSSSQITTITFPIRLKKYSGTDREQVIETEMSMDVNSALADTIKSGFEEMYELDDFYIEWDEKYKVPAVYGFDDRSMRDSPKLSHHAYGTAVDINSISNPFGGSQAQNEFTINDEVIEIWTKRGFYWGGNWSGKKDYMHFTYLGS